MVDLHFHLLPGVDDGPPTLAEAVAMARAAWADGCEVVVATPHQRHPRWPNLDVEELTRLLEQVRDAVGDQPRLHLGAEIREGVGVLEDLEHGRLLGLGGGASVLIEFNRLDSSCDLEDLVHELVLLGRPPLLAHVERIPWLAADLPRLGGLAQLGAATQLTSSSLFGAFGRGAQIAAWRLLDAGLVDVLASDAHRLEWRPPGIAAARQLIDQRYGLEIGRLLTVTNPTAILAGERLVR